MAKHLEETRKPDGHLEVDAQLTRRKVYHVMYDDAGNEVWRTQRFLDLIDHARERGWSKLGFECKTASGPVVVTLLISKKD